MLEDVRLSFWGPGFFSDHEALPSRFISALVNSMEALPGMELKHSFLYNWIIFFQEAYKTKTLKNIELNTPQVSKWSHVSDSKSWWRHVRSVCGVIHPKSKGYPKESWFFSMQSYLFPFCNPWNIYRIPFQEFMPPSTIRSANKNGMLAGCWLLAALTIASPEKNWNSQVHLHRLSPTTRQAFSLSGHYASLADRWDMPWSMANYAMLWLPSNSQLHHLFWSFDGENHAWNSNSIMTYYPAACMFTHESIPFFLLFQYLTSKSWMTFATYIKNIPHITQISPTFCPLSSLHCSA